MSRFTVFYRVFSERCHINTSNATATVILEKHTDTQKKKRHEQVGGIQRAEIISCDIGHICKWQIGKCRRENTDTTLTSSVK